MIHILNRATNLVVQHLTDEQRDLFTFGTPSNFNNLADELINDNPEPEACSMSAQCGAGIVYALRL